MAVTPRHGQSAVVLIDERNFSVFLNSATVSASMEPGETTTFASAGNKTFIPGLKDATVSADGLFSASTVTADDIANYLDGAHGGSTKMVVTVGLEGDAIGRRALLLTGDQTAYDINSPVSDIVNLSLDIQASSGYRSGRWLRNLVSTTGASAAVDSGSSTGGSAGGGIGHLHVTAMNATGSATFKIQHSTSGSTWADLITFAAATQASFQRSTVAGTIKEQVRALNSAQGSTANVFTAAVAFARRGSPLK